MTDRRAIFDFEIEFANGGGLDGRDFRLDLDSGAVDERALGAQLVADLRLLMVAAVRLHNVRVVEEPHKRSVRPSGLTAGTILDLSHVIRDGLITYPGLPAPVIGTHLSREASRERYAPGTEFHIGTISMVANTGTYLDTPFHRYPDGVDLAGLDAEACAGIDGVVVRVAGQQSIGVDALADVETWGRAVLFHTGSDRLFGTPAYAQDSSFLTEGASRRLVNGGARLVGIDALNVDDVRDGTRPAHSLLLAAGIPLLEHLAGLEHLPDEGFEVFALPPLVEGMGTFPVRAIARITR